MSLRKLLFLNASTTALLVALLAIHFPSDELADARAELERTGSDFSRTLAEQLETRGPAALDTLARDPAIGNVLLLSAAHADVPLPVVSEPYVLEFSDRIAVVRSVAGEANGTLIVELPTHRLANLRAELTRVAVTGGLGALALGMMLTIALRRLERTLQVRAARERTLEVVLRAPPANDNQPQPHARTG